MNINLNNDPWLVKGYDPYKGMTDDERMKVGCLQGVVFVLMMVAGLAFCALMGSCTTERVVTVPQQHTEHHWHTDSVHQTDSIIKETTTTIMQLDSAAMAVYGIRLQAAERAWLVRTAELERHIARMEALSAVRDTVRDTVTVVVTAEPRPAEKETLTWWQQTRIHLANIILYVLAIVAIYYIGKNHIRRLLP